MSNVPDDCGCCAGITPETPALITNRPGLTAIAYRVGTHNQFMESMLAALSNSNWPQLRALTTRSDDDFSIALLDAFATMADVITFYQERIANESYLRTATQRESLLELARLIGYELRPGVAASAYLAFTLDPAYFSTPGAPDNITIPTGVKVQSVPGPNQMPQTFETVEDIDARPEWSAIRPRLTQPQLILSSMGSVIAKGTSTNLNPGDKLLIVDVSGPELRTVRAVSVDNQSQTTQIDFSKPSLSPAHLEQLGWPSGSVSDFANKIELSDQVVQEILNETWDQKDLTTIAAIQGWDLDELTQLIIAHNSTSVDAPDPEGVFAFRKLAAIFGYNAPEYDSLPSNWRNATIEYVATSASTELPVFHNPPAYPNSWEGKTVGDDSGTNENFVYLDSTYSAIIKNSWIALVSPTAHQPFQVEKNLEVTRFDYAISGKISQITIDVSAAYLKHSLGDFSIRGTGVLVQSEKLPLADVPILDPVDGDTIVLDSAYLSLKPQMKVMLTGEPINANGKPSGITTSEMKTLKKVILQAGFTIITVDSPLAYSYVRDTVTINANVASATHGETVQETVGSGDVSQPYQEFVLKQLPLTYVSAATSTGAESTFQLLVNGYDRSWYEVPTLSASGPKDHVFITRIADDQTVTVEFGDGVTGARLPSGKNNLQATYRKGIGLAGQVKAGQLSVLQTRPLGVKGVINPKDATGAMDPESIDDARLNAPITVLTLGRAVSLEDYEDFARGFAGVAKALATWTWDGQTRRVFLTVAGAEGATIDSSSDTYEKLLEALKQAGDPFVDLLVKSYRPAYFKVAGNFIVDPNFESQTVSAALELALRSKFSFDVRSFGQPVALSEVIAVMQSVPGIIAVDLKEFYRSDKTPAMNDCLFAEMPVLTDSTPAPAELLTLDPAPLDGLVMIQ
jgi:predicted phage baseplate assembly protein